MSSPVSTPNVIPREGEIAFARSVSTLYDLTLGLVNWPVWLRKTSIQAPMSPPLVLSNKVDGGACLDILNYLEDRENPVTRFTNRGIHNTEVGGWMDFHYQTEIVDGEEVPMDPATPALDSEIIRMYAKDGGLYFKLPGIGIPQQMLIGEPPGPAARFTYWMAGG